METELQTDFGYTGQRNNAGISMMDYNARWYTPSIGRFTATDTIVPNMYDPQSLNRYSYVLNNPVRYQDPSGHWNVDINDEENNGPYIPPNHPDNPDKLLKKKAKKDNEGRRGGVQDAPALAPIEPQEPEFYWTKTPEGYVWTNGVVINPDWISLTINIIGLVGDGVKTTPFGIVWYFTEVAEIINLTKSLYDFLSGSAGTKAWTIISSLVEIAAEVGTMHSATGSVLNIVDIVVFDMGWGVETRLIPCPPDKPYVCR